MPQDKDYDEVEARAAFLRSVQHVDGLKREVLTLRQNRDKARLEALKELVSTIEFESEESLNFPATASNVSEETIRETDHEKSGTVDPAAFWDGIIIQLRKYPIDRVRLKIAWTRRW